MADVEIKQAVTINESERAGSEFGRRRLSSSVEALSVSSQVLELIERDLEKRGFNSSPENVRCVINLIDASLPSVFI